MQCDRLFVSFDADAIAGALAMNGRVHFSRVSPNVEYKENFDAADAMRLTGVPATQADVSIGRPDFARDVIEAMMLERGLRRRFDPLVEREARVAAERVGPAA